MSLGYAFAKDRNQIRIILSILTREEKDVLYTRTNWKEVGYIFLALPAMCSVSSLS